MSALIHVTDIHAQLKPIYFREPEVQYWCWQQQRCAVPHVTGAGFRKPVRYRRMEVHRHYALTYRVIFPLWHRSYGRVGGLDRVATVINAIRARTPGRAVCWMAATHGTVRYTCYQDRKARTWST